MGKLTIRNFANGNYYHIITRGNNQQKVFFNDSDRKRFLLKLEEYSEKYNVTILCFVLMPNHVHLLLRQNTDVPISKFMQALNTSCTMYFNLKYKRSGHLFQGRFHSILVDKDEYLIQLSRYIHLNPVKAGLGKTVGNYTWSSYLDYVGEQHREFVETKFILGYFSKKNSQKDYEEFVKTGLTKEEYPGPELRSYTLE